MRARGNQLLIQILLMIIITVIVAYTGKLGTPFLSVSVKRSERQLLKSMRDSD